MHLPVEYLAPVVLRCSHIDGYPLGADARYAPRMVYEYEFEYFLHSDGGIVIDGTYVPFSAGEMNIRKPGQVVQGVLPYDCYVLCVDMLGNAKRAEPYLFGTPDEAQERYHNSLLLSLPDKLRIDKPQLVTSLLDMIHRFHDRSGDLAHFQTKSALFFLLSELFQQAANRSAGSTERINRAVRRILEGYAGQLSVDALVQESGYGKAFFHQQFRRETGTTPGKMIARLRIEKAKELLAITGRTVAEIGALCGYVDNSYFARAFARETGLTPSAYRARIGMAPDDPSVAIEP